MRNESDLTRGMNKKSLIEYFKIKHAEGRCCKQIFNLSLIHAEGGSLMQTEGELSEAIHTNENIMPKADLRSINENSQF